MYSNIDQNYTLQVPEYQIPSKLSIQAVID